MAAGLPTERPFVPGDFTPALDAESRASIGRLVTLLDDVRRGIDYYVTFSCQHKYNRMGGDLNVEISGPHTTPTLAGTSALISFETKRGYVVYTMQQLRAMHADHRVRKMTQHCNVAKYPPEGQVIDYLYWDDALAHYEPVWMVKKP